MHREAVELDQHQETDQRLQQHEGGRLGDRHLAGGDRARAGALDQPVEIAIDQIVPGAAGAAHGEGADEEQHDVPEAGELLDAHAGKPHRPPARHQQQPGSDRPVEAGEPQIGAGERRRETVDPVSGRIGDASGVLAHLLPSGVPVRVSKVPRPVLMLLESVIGRGERVAQARPAPAAAARRRLGRPWCGFQPSWRAAA